MIRFRELLRCVGVDEEHQPPGVVIAQKRTTMVLLDTDGGKRLNVISTHPAIAVKQVDGTAMRSRLIDLNIEVNQPDVDPLFKEAMLPTSMFWYDKPTFWEIR